MTGLLSLILEGLPLWVITTAVLAVYVVTESRNRNPPDRRPATLALEHSCVSAPAAWSGRRWDRFALSVSLHFILLAGLERSFVPYPALISLPFDQYNVITVENRIPVQDTMEIPSPAVFRRENHAAGQPSKPKLAAPLQNPEIAGTEGPSRRVLSKIDLASSSVSHKKRDDPEGLQDLKQAALLSISADNPEDPALRDLVLHPDFTIPFGAQVPLKLPPVLVWAVSPSPLEDKPVVEPVEATNSVARWSLPTGFTIQSPEQRRALAELGVAPAPALGEQPRLALPVAQLGLWHSPTVVLPPAAPPSLSGGRGEQALLVLPETPDLPSETFDLPEAFRLASHPPVSFLSGDEATSSRPGGEEDGRTVANNKGNSASIDNAKPGQLASNRATDEPQNGLEGMSQHEDARKEDRKGSDEVSRPVSSQVGIPSQPADPGAGGQPLQPVPRNLHGIILVSNSLPTIPEAQGLLTGNPIYTVYLNVPNAVRKWTLQFCVPKSAVRQLEFETAGVIRIVPRKKVSPPYARYMQAIPPASLATDDPLRASPALVFFTLDEQGEMGDLQLVRGGNAWLNDQILSSLRAWQFMPAFRGREPVAIEVLLTIPPS